MADPQGIIARVTTAFRFAATGVAPADWFGPGKPIAPMAPPEVKGRRFDYSVAVNLNYLPRSNQPISFVKLKQLAEQSNILRMVLERQKDLIKSQEWSIKARLKENAKKDDAGIAEIKAFFDCPDGLHDWSQWLNAILEQLFVIDAVSIYARLRLNGKLFSLEVLDGATITPLIDQTGRQPLAPDVAYEQILKGIVAAQFTTDELIYYPQNYRADKLYGYSRVEQVIVVAEQTIQRMKSQLGYFTNGNIGDGYFTAPESYNPDQTRGIETHWNDLMTTSPEARRQLPFLPGGTEFHPTKIDVLQDAFDEWLTRLVCFVFGVSPTPFLKQQGLGHGSAKTDQQAATEGGFLPMMQYIQRLMNRIIAQQFQRPDLEFVWDTQVENDTNAKSEIDDRDFKNGTKTINKIRDERGEDAIVGGDVAVIVLGQAVIPVASLLNLPLEPAPPPTALAPAEAAPLIDAAQTVKKKSPVTA